MTFVEQLNRSRPGGCWYYTLDLYSYNIFNPLQWHLQLSETGLGRYMNYTFEFPKSFAACEVVRLTALYLFFISGCLVWQHVSMGRPGWERQAGGRLWISLYEPTGSSASADSDWAVAIVAFLGEKGAKCLSIKTGSVRSQDGCPPSPPKPSHGTPAWVQWDTTTSRETEKQTERYFFFSEIAFKHFCSARAGKGGL